MRAVCFVFTILFSSLASAQTYKVSELKFENFKAYEQYGIDTTDIRRVLIAFSQKNPSFEQSGLFLLAAELAEIYRAEGLAFHRVEVVLGPPTRLILVPGVMGGIDLRGNQLYSRNQLTPFFTDLTGNLVDNKTLQSAMTRMNTLPGFAGFAFLSFGQRPGEAILNVSANQESWGQVNTQINNYGSEATGTYRLSSQLTLNNPLKLSEQWQIGGSLSDNTENWSADAAVEFNQLGKRKIYLQSQYQRIAITQSFDLLSLAGWQGSANLGVRSIALQKLNSTFAAYAQLGYLQQELTNAANVSFLNVSIQELPIRAGIEGDFAANKTYLGYEFNADAAYVLRHESSASFAPSLWSLVQNKTSFAQSITGGVLQKGIDFKTQIQAQYALTELPSHRRFSLSGPNKVANLEAGNVMVDQGVFVESSLTLLNMQAGWFQGVLQAIGQTGFGRLNDQDVAPIYAVGAGLDLNLGVLSSELKVFSDENFSQPKVWFEVGLNWPRGR